MFEEALKQPGWIDDKVVDQSRGLVARTPRSGNPLSDLDNGEGHCNSN